MSRRMVCALAILLGTAGCAPRPLIVTAARTPTPPHQAPADAAPAASARLAPPEKDQPVSVTSEHLQYSENGRVSVFTGRVRVRQGTALLEAPYLEVRSQGGEASAQQGVRLTDAARAMTITARELRYKESLAFATLYQNVKVESQDPDGVPLRLRSQKLEWDNDKKTARASDQVMVTYGRITATAQVLDFDQTEEKIVLSSPEGTVGKNPEMVKAGDTLSGRLITLFLKQRRYVVTGSAIANLWLQNLSENKKP